MADTVVLPPVTVAGYELNFFCGLAGEGAARDVVATLQAWCRLHRLRGAELAKLGAMDEDGWYDLARQWMLEARRKLTSWNACAQAIAAAQAPIDMMGAAGGQLRHFLATYGWLQFTPAK
ncbi:MULTISPECIES: hypothetical protein [unclassified Variovorax]|uniref:hypothetical protein n=1 Tax=unclassified Variovorax TaxID=663243 RepID=UPI00076DE7D0|nr:MULTISPECIES: hypothetical protein [unclassified Variovorax]KWT98419.1 hypothetical protein APY03_0554 [Variovorax sp. WDL1]PNG49912.1 hypothetical protein CHC06_05493 [Variovorax sp. B2]PNG50784.1 hypothetical protein CHC07_05398 [Variovorax sp. B4]VTV18002.1 hypothetical protein WDL1P1_00836 [Variovorax sp. WDL1]